MRVSFRTVSFLSTLPVRGATHLGEGVLQDGVISIHAPREGSDYGTPWYRLLKSSTISIHAPREGSDVPWFSILRPAVVFLSTLPVRGATQIQQGSQCLRHISIHAPREGSDPFHPGSLTSDGNFYPRSP